MIFNSHVVLDYHQKKQNKQKQNKQKNNNIIDHRRENLVHKSTVMEYMPPLISLFPQASIDCPRARFTIVKG